MGGFLTWRENTSSNSGLSPPKRPGRRILDAVARRLREAPSEPVSLDQVAKLARVARSTIYLIFGSRAGLFDAFTEDLADRTGLARLTEAVASPDTRQHLREGIAAGYRMFAQDLVVYRVLFSMNHIDPASLGGAVERMEHRRAGGMAYLARRLAEDSVLRDDVTVKQAEDLLWVLCSFETFDSPVYGARQVARRDHRGGRLDGRACAMPAGRITSL